MTRNELDRMPGVYNQLARPMFGRGSLFESLAREFDSVLPASPIRKYRKEDGTVCVEYNLAGFEKDEISVKVDSAKSILYVSAESNTEDNKRSFSTALTLNEYIKPEDISVGYKNGVLTLEVKPVEGREEEALAELEIN